MAGGLSSSRHLWSLPLRIRGRGQAWARCLWSYKLDMGLENEQTAWRAAVVGRARRSAHLAAGVSSLAVYVVQGILAQG